MCAPWRDQAGGAGPRRRRPPRRRGSDSARRSTATRHERAAAESPSSFRDYWDLHKLAPFARPIYPLVAAAVLGRRRRRRSRAPSQEGDEIAGFKVVELPGHAPGLIGLFREEDRLALVSDCIYTLDPADRDQGPDPGFRIRRSTWTSIRPGVDPQAGRTGPERRLVRSRQAGRRRRRHELERAAVGAVPDACSGRRSARRSAAPQRDERRVEHRAAEAPTAEYRDAEGNVLDAARVADAGRAARVRARLARRARTARTPGSARPSCCSSGSPCRGRSPALELDRQQELLGRYRMASATSARSCVKPCASTSRSTSRSWRPREPRCWRRRSAGGPIRTRSRR